MCNHYRQAILKGAVIPGWSIDQFSEIRIPLRFHNQPADVYPDREGLVVRVEDGAPVVETMRWGFPPPPSGKRPVTNVRNTTSTFWRPWLMPKYRCLIPVSMFSEFGQETPRKEYWFTRADDTPMWFAGIWRTWEGVRGTKLNPVSGEHRLFSFLTCEPNALVKPIHPKAMPVVLESHDCEAWLTSPLEEALKLQRPLKDGVLKIAPSEEAD